MQEIWKEIQELSGDYEVSTLGRIKSKERIVEYPYQETFRKRKISEKILKPRIRMTGERVDCVEYMIRDKTYLISHLVYFYFVSNEPIPEGYCIAHQDKNPLNNTPSNVVKMTWKESRKLDHIHSARSKIWQLERSKRGGQAMKRKAFFNRIKFINPNEK